MAYRVVRDLLGSIKSVRKGLLKLVKGLYKGPVRALLLGSMLASLGRLASSAWAASQGGKIRRNVPWSS